MIPIFKVMKKIALFIFSLYVWTFFLAFFVVIMPFQLLCVALPWRWAHLIAHYLNDFWGLWLFILTFSPIRVEKRGDFPFNQSYIIVANHHSYVDIPLLHVVFFFKDIRFIGKKELANIPIWGWIYRRLHIIVDRSRAEAGAAALKYALQKLNQGSSIVIFPEGTTRKKEGQLLLPFKDGAFALSAETQTPILPVAIIGTKKMLDLQKRGLIIQPTKLRVVIFPPVSPPQNKSEAIKKIKNEIYTLIAQTVRDGESNK